MKLVESLGQLLAALDRGDATESAQLVHDLNGRYPVEVRELSGEELAAAMALHDKCTHAAEQLKAKLLEQMSDAARGQRAANAYRGY